MDLNLKDEERYENTFQYYFEGIQPSVIVWLVSNRWIANRIRQAHKEIAYGEKNEFFNKKVAFVLVEDFKQKVWEAQVIDGPMKGMSIRKLHSNLLQNQIKLSSNIGQKSLQAIFFPKFKSPQKSVV